MFFLRFFGGPRPRFGFSGEDSAAYDLPLAAVTAVVLLWASRAAEDAARPLSYVPKPAIQREMGEFMVDSNKKTWDVMVISMI